VAGILRQCLLRRRLGGRLEGTRLQRLAILTRGQGNCGFPLLVFGPVVRGARQILLECVGLGVCGPERPHLGQPLECLGERARLQPLASLFEQLLNLAVLERGPHLLAELDDATVIRIELRRLLGRFERRFRTPALARLAPGV
jgi:hypothetical protein